MKKIACLIILLAALVSCANAYIINFDVPPQVNLGDTVVIEGTSTINPGVTMTIVLYNQKVSIQEIERKSFVIQSDGSWKVSFETDSLSKGNYKLEIPDNSEVSLGGSSTRYRTFELIDRTDQIVIASSINQEYNGFLSVEGRSTTRGNLGIEIMVDDGEYVIFPEEWVSTDSNGQFKVEVPISGPGNYYVSFSDNKGLIRHQKFTSVKTTTSPTQSLTQSITPVPTSNTGKSMSAQSFASLNSPAYFSIETFPGILTVETSEGHNWAVEYCDEKKTVKTVNRYSGSESESFGINVEGGTVYVKVYPVDSSDSGYVTVFTTGASSITVSEDSASFFESAPAGEATQSGGQFPIGLISAVIGLFVIVILTRRQ